MRITALQRGGLAVYGGFYDPHANEAIVQVRDGESVGVTIEYPSAPSAITTAVSGATTTEPAISGVKAALTLSGLNDGGRVDITATVGGAQRTIRIRAESCTRPDRYDCDRDLIGS